jgi:hypothetical protein
VAECDGGAGRARRRQISVDGGGDTPRSRLGFGVGDFSPPIVEEVGGGQREDWRRMVVRRAGRRGRATKAGGGEDEAAGEQRLTKSERRLTAETLV